MVVFIAIELEQVVRERIFRYVREVVKPQCRGGRWVDSANYHLTLKYIGAAREQEVEMLYGLLNETASRHGSIRLTTGRVGVFGGSDGGRARVLWLDTAGDVEILRGLRRDIEGGAVGLGFKRENRFSPHITLARDVVLTGKRDEMERMQPVRINVNSISLMESRMERGKRIYLPLSVHRFK